MEKIITSRNWYDAENYDRTKEPWVMCECGHCLDMHEWDDYEGDSCIGDDCECSNKKILVKDNKIVYDKDVPK